MPLLAVPAARAAQPGDVAVDFGLPLVLVKVTVLQALPLVLLLLLRLQVCRVAHATVLCGIEGLLLPPLLLDP